MTQMWKISLVLMAILVISFRSDPTSVQDDTNKQILAALNAGNADVLSSFFNDMIDLGVAGNEDTYSKTQATRILKDFFMKNPVKSVKFTSEGSSTDGSKFTIGEMKAGTGTYRLYYLLKKVSGKFLIQQLQIQKQN